MYTFIAGVRRRVQIRQGFCFIVRKNSHKFWLAFPRRSKNADKEIFWGDSEKKNAVATSVPANGHYTRQLDAATIMAQTCAKLFNLKSVLARPQLEKDCLEFVFKK